MMDGWLPSETTLVVVGSQTLHPLKKMQKQKQMFAYSVFRDGETYLAGQSRSATCETIHDLHNNGDMTPISRFPLGDEINTEYGFMTRDAYLENKKLVVADK